VVNLLENLRELHLSPYLGKDLEADRVGGLEAAQKLRAVRLHVIFTVFHLMAASSNRRRLKRIKSTING